MPDAHRIKLIVGLGNPGSEYEDTRHNVGAWFIEALCQQYNTQLKVQSKFKSALGEITIPGADQVRLMIPTTYMNDSGEALQAVSKFYKYQPSEILIAHDELDFDAGVIRLKHKGGHGGHNGLRSVMQHVGPDFTRLRIGIGHPGNSKDVTNYVLKRPSKDEENQIRDTIVLAIRHIDDIVAGDIDKATRELHS